MLTNVNQTIRPEVVIVGAGLCGIMVALYLARRGYFVEIYEKANDSTEHSFSSKRSAELDLSERGLCALAEVGLLNQIVEKAVPTENRVILFPDKTRITIQHSAQKHQVIYNISRADLYNILCTATKNEPRINIHFSHRLVSVEAKNNLLIFENNKTDSFLLKKYSALLGCDGANSILRHALNESYKNNTNYSHVYKEVALPFSFVNQHLSIKSMYKWINKKAIFLAHPKITQHFSGTFILPQSMQNRFSQLFTSLYFPQLKNIMGQLLDELIDQPVGRLKSTKVNCQQSEGILLLGDAAHGMLPFLGQGINCAFEDCRLFNRYLKLHQDNWENAIQHFARNRQPDTNAIIDMSEIEYQEFETGYTFGKQQFFEKFNAQLEERYPHIFKSYRYLLAFSHIPYAVIKKQQQLQRYFFSEIYKHFSREIKWDRVDAWIKNISQKSDIQQYIAAYN